MYEFIYYRVEDVMTPEPVMVDKHVTLSDTEEIFEKYDFNGIPVVDERRQLIGMMTKLDFLKAFAFTEKSKTPHYDAIMGQKISNVLTRDPRVVYPETPLTRVVQYMIETGYKSFPVIDDDRVVGIIAREDIIRALRQAAQGEGPARGGRV
ncbi:MAG: CBS domain-containing protein [Deltaproteobacteria bacterium]|nr:CBS domain-containing protein [Deltaproteobacteria bacterium]